MAELNSGRIIFKTYADQLDIIIPAKSNWPLLVILIMISVFWWFTGGNNIMAVADQRDAEPLDWIWICWGAALVLIIIRNLWLALVSKETVIIKNGTLSIKKQGLLLLTTKKYELAKVKYFSTDENSNYSFFDNPLSNDVGSGTVCFGYGQKNVRFGEGLSEAEGEYILQKLKQKGLLTDNIS